MQVSRVDSLDFDTFYKLLTSNKITEAQKTQFVISNHNKIKHLMSYEITNVEFNILMQNRILQKFRPLKNSYTKAGDKVILAKALNVPTQNIPKYIKKVAQTLKETHDLDFLPHSTLEMIKTYVYRHGSKDELVAFLDYELTKSEDKIKTLYKTLEYYSGGIADYFIRPIHRMDNKTLVKIFSIINKHINKAYQEGNLSEAESQKHAKWALLQIYNIQNNSKLINAIKTYSFLK
jgi:hypothetical protein